MKCENLTDEIVNKGLAEFMGHEDVSFTSGFIINGLTSETYCPKYTLSLDSLVPVWQKLKSKKIGYNFTDNLFFVQSDFYGQCFVQYFHDGTETIQQAAAHTTYLAVMELKGEVVE